MVSIDKLVQTWMASGRDEEITETVSDISNDRTSLIKVVLALGEYLTSEESELRRKGVEFLSLVLQRSPLETMNRQSVRVLTKFYCEKLDDAEAVKPALSGILILVSLPTFSPPEVTAVIEGLFQHIRMKALVQSVRFIVFSIIDSLVARHRNVLKLLGKQFLSGYIALAEGEKDPRNLLVAFAVVRVLLIEFDISEHVESLFNIVFCYFPITFRPPPNDPYGISTDDLRMALRGTLNATPSFGPLAIPVFLDKLTAGSRVTKIDTLRALATSLPVYGPALARASARKLWNALKLEIFQPVDSQTEEEALLVTQVLIKTIYAEEEVAVESDGDIQGLARDACEECINILKEPEKSQAKPAAKVLCAFISTTPSVSRYTISQTIPHLIRLFLDADEAPNRPATLLLLSEFTEAARDSMKTHKNKENEMSPKIEPLLIPYKDELLGVLSAGLFSSSTRDAALLGLDAIVSMQNLLSDEEIGFIVHNVDQVLEGDQDGIDDASDFILRLLTTITSIAPHHVAEQTLPLLFRSLPDSAPPRAANGERGKCCRILSALQTLCIQSELFENLVVRLTTKLDLICLPSARQIESDTAYAHAILKTLSQTLAVKVQRKDPDVAKYIDRLVPHIFNLFISSTFLSDERPVITTDPRLLHVAGQIITLVVQSLPLQRQKSYSMGISKALIDGDVTDIAQGFQKIINHQKLTIFTGSSTSIQKNLIALFTAAVVPFHKEVQLALGDIGQFLDALLAWILDVADTELAKMSALQMLSSVVNRQSNELASFLNDKLDIFWFRAIRAKSLPVERRVWAIKSWTWISKALLVQKHPLAITFAERLYEAFDDVSISWEAAKAIGEIPQADSILTKANHAVVKILYVQKYVNAVLPRIISSAKHSTDETQRTAFLVALAFLIKSIPKASYIQEMPTLIPLLLRGLELSDSVIRNNVIDTFLASAGGESPEKNLVSEHSSTLVNFMLKNSRLGELSTTRVRISALRYLAVLPDIVRYDILHPHKANVLRELSKVLDDPKRSVRKEAVNARTKWFKYKG